ncbi:MAG: hypothetical protein ACRDRO_08875 [Pseudonocardiaceae bacterium]
MPVEIAFVMTAQPSSRQIVRMDYGPDGTQLGRELIEDVDPAPYVAWKQLALEHAEPFTENLVMREG